MNRYGCLSLPLLCGFVNATKYAGSHHSETSPINTGPWRNWINFVPQSLTTTFWPVKNTTSELLDLLCLETWLSRKTWAHHRTAHRPTLKGCYISSNIYFVAWTQVNYWEYTLNWNWSRLGGNKRKKSNLSCIKGTYFTGFKFRTTFYSKDLINYRSTQRKFIDRSVRGDFASISFEYYLGNVCKIK